MISIDGMPKDYTFQPVYQYGSRAELTEFSSFSELLDTFYRKKDQQENLRRRSADLTRTAKTARDRLLRKIAAREQELLETEKREEYRRRGDLITANMYRLKRGMRFFEAQDYYEPDCPTVTVPLDERKTPQQNAAYNYKLYNKAKTANRMLTELIAAAREDEAYLESVLDELSRAECDRDLADIRRELVNAGYIKEKTQGKRQKQPAARKPLRFVSDSGTEILVGRGNVQNDELTLHIARRTDLWLHVQKLPGSHVIVSQAEGEADEETIRQAAALAATYSQAKTGGKVAVDCTQVRFVKKPSGAKPGRVIYTGLPYDHHRCRRSAGRTAAKRLKYRKPAGETLPVQPVRKRLAEFAPAGANRVLIIFSGDMCVGENTFRLANVRAQRVRCGEPQPFQTRAQRSGSRLRACQKHFFERAQPAGETLPVSVAASMFLKIILAHIREFVFALFPIWRDPGHTLCGALQSFGCPASRLGSGG